MNSKSHLIISLIKSIIRFIGCVYGIYTKSFIFSLYLFGIAEVLGVCEELFDNR